MPSEISAFFICEKPFVSPPLSLSPIPSKPQVLYENKAQARYREPEK